MAAVPASAGLKAKVPDDDRLDEQMMAIVSMADADSIHSEIASLQAKLDFYAELAILQAEHARLINRLASGVVIPVTTAREEQKNRIKDLWLAKAGPSAAELLRALNQAEKTKAQLASRLTELQKEDAVLASRVGASLQQLAGSAPREVASVEEEAKERVGRILTEHGESWDEFTSSVLPRWHQSVRALQQRVSVLQLAEQRRQQRETRRPSMCCIS
ncbi:hypothetical protein DIPPA_31490 [Diplonema papillatum]|nr:hypothetical protein DIPPA_31490 [Diplonema papillatum]